MRLRTIMFVLFCVIAIAPMILFWALPNSGMLTNELEEAEDRQIVIARLVADRLSFFHKDLVNTFHLISEQPAQTSTDETLSGVLKSFGIENVCLFNSASGKLTRSISNLAVKCDGVLEPKRLQHYLKEIADASESVATTGIFSNNESQTVYYLLKKETAGIVVAQVSTKYIRDAGKLVKFGSLGHAAITDKDGKAISHPKSEWEQTGFDMSRVPVVPRMLNGETGVDQFYSPALDAFMFAAFTRVEGPGWGVMIPQPLNELRQKAEAVKYSMLTVLVIGLLLAGLLAFIASKLLTDPIEQMVRAMNRIGAGELRAYEQMNESKWHPIEFNAARDGIKAMSERLRENIDTISRHAYLDGITGLPNRECFRVLAQEEIEKMSLSGRKCALLFLDLDGFKQVNDVYGHRSGDDLLKGFASRLHTYCGNVMKKHARGTDNALRILPARLGGDEFVVLLSNMRDVSLTSEFAEGLFQKVFGPLKIHNGVSLQVNGSVGGALFPEMATDFDELLRLSDIAMYTAKNSGKGRFCLYSTNTDGNEPAHKSQMQHA